VVFGTGVEINLIWWRARGQRKRGAARVDTGEKGATKLQGEPIGWCEQHGQKRNQHLLSKREDRNGEDKTKEKGRTKAGKRLQVGGKREEG